MYFDIIRYSLYLTSLMLVYLLTGPFILLNYCIVNITLRTPPPPIPPHPTPPIISTPPLSVTVWFVFLWRGAVVVQSLRHQVYCQTVLGAAGFFDFGPLILKPDFDLRFIEAQFLRQTLASLLCQVAVVLELGLESLELLRREGRAWSFVLLTCAFRLWFTRSGTCVWGCNNIQFLERSTNCITGPIC